MLTGRTTWLAFNEGSGSNNEAAHAALDEAFTQAECKLHRRIRFPDDPPPTIEALREEDVELLVIFAGDGTISSIVTKLYGWTGSVLVLPGGTMNLLSLRLHGEADAAEIIARAASGKATSVRPTILRSAYGDGLTGMLAGPGTAWSDVREAMRETDVLGVLRTAKDAISQSTSGPMITLREPAVGRDEGYAAMMLTPLEEGIELNGFYADSVRDYLQQGLALARRNFRDGPHEDLGRHQRVQLASSADGPIGLLIDGESIDAGADEVITLARCEVDLIATAPSEPFPTVRESGAEIEQALAPGKFG